MSKNTITQVAVAESESPIAAPAAAPAGAQAQFESSRMDTKRLLDLQEKRQVRLKAAGRNELNYETVCVNGYIFQIMRGVEVKVPQTVYDILDEAGII